MTIRKGKTIIAGNIPAGYEIGDIGLSAIGIDESLNYRRYLNGQEILQAQFPEFTKKIKRRVELYPSLACSDYQYETYLLTSAHGQCGKFVIDDERGVIRLPKVVNVMGLSDMAEAGVTVDAGLPNIEGVESAYWNIFGSTSGAFAPNTEAATNTAAGATSVETSYAALSFDASRCSEVYGNSETVQQEAIKYPYFIQVASSSETTINLTRDIELNNPFSLFEYKFSEYAIDNISWLESKGQWNSNKVYVSAYEELLAIYNGKVREGVSVKKTTETYTDYDFVIDEAGNAFRLPIRVKETPLSAGKVGVAGNGMTLGLTTGGSNAGAYTASNFNVQLTPQYYGADVGSGVGSGLANAGSGTLGITSDKTKSGIEADLTDAVVDLKLYFYVGETVQDGNLINAGAVLEDVNILKNTALTTNQITNCITEIPQRIKLELADGVLTLKAGSEVIIPNGFEEDGVTPKFDYTFTPIDISAGFSDAADGDYMVFVRTTLDQYDFRPLGRQSSGDTASDPQTAGWHYYNTQTNKVDCYLANGGLIQDSFPICVMTMADNKVQSIKQVFNGMGYIGGTVWVNKGVKGLAVNGRSADGTLKNKEVVFDGISISPNITVTPVTPFYVYMRPNNSARFASKTMHFEQNEKPVISATYATWYSPAENILRFTNDSGTTWHIADGFIPVADILAANNSITSFEQRETFRAVDYSDSSAVSGWGMPSNKYIALSLGSSGTTYKAPANGWFAIVGKTTVANGYVHINNGHLGIISQYNSKEAVVRGFVPATRGDAIGVSYSSFTLDSFRFFYAEGEI